MGWLLDYVSLYRKYYPADSWDKVWYRIPMAKGYCLIAAAMSHDAWFAFSGVKMVEGYIAQEIEKRTNGIRTKN